MTEQELFDAFISGFPETYHTEDIRRFAAYAIAAIRNDHDFNAESFANAIPNELVREDYRFAFECIREAMRMLY